MSRIDKSISDSLGIEFEPDKKVPTVVEQVEQEIIEPVQVEPTGNSDIEDDYNFSRDTLKKVIDKGKDAVIDAQIVAQQNEHPDSYKALAALIKSVSSATKDLYEVHEKTKNLKGTSGKKVLDNGNINVDKAIFVGTTSDLLKQIKGKEGE